MAAEQTRTYAAAHFGLEFGNKEPMGLFRSIEGGGVKADVMTYQYGHGYDRWRLLGKPKFEDIKLQVGMAMSSPFYDWIEKFFRGEEDRRDGAIVAMDFYYNERARREFTQGLIKELTFPKLDAQDKNAVYMSLGVAVEHMEFKPGGGQKVVMPKGMTEQKMWNACNFTFSLDGFDQSAWKRVTKIDSFTIKQNVMEYHTGQFRYPIKVGSQVEFPNITFYVPESDAGPFFERVTQNAIKGGQQSPTQEKAGELRCFDNGGQQLFRLEFFDADIVSVTPDKSDANSEEIKQVKVELVTESMKFFYGSK